MDRRLEPGTFFGRTTVGGSRREHVDTTLVETEIQLKIS